jgi:hypothetical protein
MKNTHEIIAGGGWHVEHHRLRPKALWFTGISAAWSAFWIIAAVTGPSDPGTQSFFHWSVADWVARVYGLLLFHPIFIVLAIIFWVTEKPRDVAIRTRSGCEPRKLY